MYCTLQAAKAAKICSRQIFPGDKFDGIEFGRTLVRPQGELQGWSESTTWTGRAGNRNLSSEQISRQAPRQRTTRLDRSTRDGCKIV